MQTVITSENLQGDLQQALNDCGARKYLLVCDQAFPHLSIKDAFAALAQDFVTFDDFAPNPLYESICKGVEVFNSECCDSIVAVGGGSALDVAKCIKLYCKASPNAQSLPGETEDTRVPLIAIPTTAGTGSESTRYAVIYHRGEKQSVTHESILPNYALLVPAVLETLPLYQKKCTMLDALCQSIESWWSVNATQESREYSKTAIELIAANWRPYILENDARAAACIMTAANYAGRAINIAATTAPHAMSYKLTSMYGLPHGHAVCLCLPEVWEHMQNHIEDCLDCRGPEYLRNVFSDISHALGCADARQALTEYRGILTELKTPYPATNANEAELRALSESVNPVRLKNNPVALTSETLYSLYERILGHEA